MYWRQELADDETAQERRGISMRGNDYHDEKLGLKELIAMGVGGMVGGGIFSVLGLSVSQAGHAAPVAFGIGGVVALLAGYCYARLGLVFRSDGGSFTYLEHAFENKNVAGIGGWMLLVGYIGTLSLYSYTFGVYGSAMFGASSQTQVVHHVLETLILLVFLGVNLYGVASAGKSEDVIVLVKVLILSMFAFTGLYFVKSSRLLPFFNKGCVNLLMGAALIFVAYEGFELIPNAVNEMENPESDLTRSIIISIVLTTVIYVLVSVVAVGNLLPEEIAKYKEYALAVAAQPFLGKAGFMLIGLGALLSTASAINATLFGTARLGMVMAMDEDLPKVFSYRERTKDIPYVSLIAITFLTLIFVNIANLTVISSFASSTFLLIFAAINLSAFKLRDRIKISLGIPVAGFLLSLSSWIVLIVYLFRTNLRTLTWIFIFYAALAVAELLFSKRRVVFR